MLFSETIASPLMLGKVYATCGIVLHLRTASVWGIDSYGQTVPELVCKDVLPRSIYVAKSFSKEQYTLYPISYNLLVLIRQFSIDHMKLCVVVLSLYGRFTSNAKTNCCLQTSNQGHQEGRANLPHGHRV